MTEFGKLKLQRDIEVDDHEGNGVHIFAGTYIFEIEDAGPEEHTIAARYGPMEVAVGWNVSFRIYRPGYMESRQSYTMDAVQLLKALAGQEK